MEEQAQWAGHAAFMNGLVEKGFVILGGPLGDGRTILLIVDTESEDAIRAELEADPWTHMDLLRIATITPWQIRLGDEGR